MKNCTERQLCILFLGYRKIFEYKLLLSIKACGFSSQHFFARMMNEVAILISEYLLQFCFIYICCLTDRCRNLLFAIANFSVYQRIKGYHCCEICLHEYSLDYFDFNIPMSHSSIPYSTF